MAAHYWIKLYQDILRDPKMGRLSDSAWRRCIELFLLCGEQEERDGTLPGLGDIAWQLRVSEQQLKADIEELEAVGIVSMGENGSVFVIKFAARQKAVDSTERWRKWRDRKRQKGYEQAEEQRESNDEPTSSNDSQTKRLTDIDKDIDKEQPPLPPLTETPADQRVRVILEVCSLEEDVPEHRVMAEDAAAQLSRYRADYILARYGRGDPAGWNWYRDDWRGQKGQTPTPRQVVQLISQPRPKPSPNGHGKHQEEEYKPTKVGSI